MRKLFIKFSLFLPVFAIVIAINIISDPSNIFRSGYEEKASEIVLSGQNVAGMTNYNERLFQKQLILSMEECPETIVLGSSRVMTMSDEAVPDLDNYHNMGVSGAGIPDYLGILGVISSRGWLPEKVIVGVDPWILNKNNGDSRHEALRAYINSFVDAIENNSNPIEMHGNETDYNKNPLSAKLQMLSPSYFQPSVSYFIRNPKAVMNHEFEFYSTSKNEVNESIRYADGSIEYDRKTREKSVVEANKDARTTVSGTVYQMEDFNELDQEYLHLLTEMVDYLQYRGTEVVFYLPPFHPQVYDFLSSDSNYKMAIEAESCFREIAKQKNIVVYGSYNPKVLACGEECFLDGLHMRRSCVQDSWKIVDG